MANYQRERINKLDFYEYTGSTPSIICTLLAENVYTRDGKYNKVHVSLHYLSNSQKRWVLLSDYKVFEWENQHQQVIELFTEFCKKINEI